MKWSFSGLKEFVNCPRQYNETRNLKRYVKGDTPQTLYGKEVHRVLEEYVRDKVPLAKNYERFKGSVDALLELPGDKLVEHKMALRPDKTPCEFDSSDYWVRGIADLLVIDGTQAFVVDYKTGSNKYPDPKQLKLMALMTFAHFPEVKEVRGGLLFLLHNTLISEDYSRDKIDLYWGSFMPDLTRLRVAYETDQWVENPTPLCGWCPVTDCTFYKPRTSR